MTSSSLSVQAAHGSEEAVNLSRAHCSKEAVDLSTEVLGLARQLGRRGQNLACSRTSLLDRARHAGDVGRHFARAVRSLCHVENDLF